MFDIIEKYLCIIFNVKKSDGKNFICLRSPSVSGPAEQPAGGSDVISLSSYKKKLV